MEQHRNIRDERFTFSDGPIPCTNEEYNKLGLILSRNGVDAYNGITAGMALTYVMGALTAQDDEIAVLRAELERANRDGMPKSEHEAFKKRAGEIAMRYAKDNGWCSTVQEALDEIGIKYEPPRIKATMVVEFEIDRAVSPSTLESFERDPVGFTRSSFDTRPNFTLDSDFDGLEVENGRVTEIRVTGEV